MGLSSALASAVAGLRANQAALSITSANVANANTPGYVAQSVNQVEVASGSSGASVLVTGVTRDIDQFIQGQLRTETGGASYANQISNILGQLQSIYGTPGGTGTLETAYNNFTSAIQALQTNTTGLSAQTTALSAAQTLAQTINATSQGIQTLRTNVNQDISNSVAQVNTDLQQIAAINTKLQGLSSTDPSAATLKDQRDSAISDVSKYVDVRAINSGTNGVNIFTTTGIQLVGDGQASQFNFSSTGTLSATSLYNSDPTKSGIGALSVTLPNGASLDVIANRVISSGQIAADLQLRDQTLVQAQTQVDQLAATLSSSLSDKTTPGTAVNPSASLAGFTLDLSNVQPGNSINLTYTNSAGQQQQVKVVRVDDPSALPLANPPGASPQVIGVNFTGGITSVVSQLNAALGQTHLQFANSSGLLQVAANPADNVTVNSASTTATVTSLTSGSPQLPFFTDAGSPYTGVITGAGSEVTGLAERIQVNPALLANPANVTVYSNSPPTPAGDTTRSDFIFKQLTSSTFTYSPQTGLGSTSSPFTGTISSYLQQFIGQQASAASSATQLQQGQSVVVSTLQQKFNSTSAVNIDSELSNLIALQNSYAANAHVMSVVQNMMQTLIQAQL